MLVGSAFYMHSRGQSNVSETQSQNLSYPIQKFYSVALAWVIENLPLNGQIDRNKALVKGVFVCVSTSGAPGASINANSKPCRTGPAKFLLHPEIARSLNQLSGITTLNLLNVILVPILVLVFVFNLAFAFVLVLVFNIVFLSRRLLPAEQCNQQPPVLLQPNLTQSSASAFQCQLCSFPD